MTNNYSNQLYQQLIHPDTARALMAGFFRDDKADAVALLQKNGIAIEANAANKDVQIAFLKALKDSDVFRDQAAAVLTSYLTRVAGHHGTSNFVGANAGRYQYYNDVSDISSLDPNSFSQAALAGSSSSSIDSSGIFSTDTGSSSASGLSSSVLNSGIFSENTGSSSSGSSAAAPASSAAANSGGFWSTLGSIFTPTVLQAGVKTGLQAVSTSMTASANQTSEANALQIEQARVQQAQAQAAAAQAGGLSTGTIVGITAAVLVVVVVVILLVRKK